MIAYIKGILTYTSVIHVVIEAQGVGYQVFIPASLYGKLPNMGEKLLLHTSFIVREQSQTLYGFLNAEERDLFELLLKVSGIGPKLALSLIGHMPTSDLCQAINSGDLATLCRIPGIGKKSAERLIIEVKDKLLTTNITAENTLANDALSALLNLGYQRSVAQKAITKTLEKSENTPDLSALITTSLKNI